MKRIRTVLFLCALALPSLPAQDVIRVETREVLVDVSVTNKAGASIPLTSKDFSIWEDGKPQKINSVSSVSTDADASQKHFVFLFDLNGMRTEDQVAARQAGIAFVDGLVSPDRYMGVVSWNDGIPIVLQNFTTARDVLKKAILVPSGVPIARPGPGAGAAIAPICESIGKAAGRKVILLFSGSFGGADKATISACNRANVAVEVITSRSPGTAFAGVDAGGRAVRSIGGGPIGVQFPGTPQSYGNAWEILAKETGGQIFVLNQTLDQQLAAVAREQDEYYRVSYTPPPAKEGSCHTLKVTTTARGADVRSRNEYCTEKPVDLVAGKIAGQGLESRAGTGNLTASMRLPFFYTGNNRASVHLVTDIIPAGMKFEKDKAGFHGQLDIVGTSVRSDGGTAARFADTVNIDLPDQQHAEAFTKTVYHYEHQFTSAAGTYTFQLAVGAGPNAVAKIEAPLAIQPWNSSTFGLSALTLSAETHAAAAVDSSEGLVLEGKGPLTAGGRQFVPAAINRFSRTAPLFFYMELYAPGGSDGLTLQYRILDPKSGEVRADSGVGTISSFIRPGNPVIPFATRLPVTEVPPGSYRLEVRVAGGPGAAPETRSIDFELN